MGAGTGIWTRMVVSAGVKTATAVEPNEEMRKSGMSDLNNNSIRWLQGSAEKTGLPDGSADLVTMASSFHWADFNSATREFHRILRPQGRFAALWNPRFIEANPLLVEIEAHLNSLRPGIKRVSSGRSGITDTLTQRLSESPYFEDVIYLEARHVIPMSSNRYLGAWRSVNDLRVQLGPEKFKEFLEFVENKISNLKTIDATYLTRVWTASRKS